MQEQQPSESGANIQPPPGYVPQPQPEGSQWGRMLAYPQGDPMGFVFIAFWVIVFGVYVTIVWGGKRRTLLIFAIAVATLVLFGMFATSLRTLGRNPRAPVCGPNGVHHPRRAGCCDGVHGEGHHAAPPSCWLVRQEVACAHS